MLILKSLGWTEHQICRIFPDALEDLINHLSYVWKQRKIVFSLSPKWSVLLFLSYLRHYPSFQLLGSLFSISRASACRYVHFLMPHVYEALASYTTISWPKNWENISLGFCGAQFIIDCTSHRRKRVHPGQQLYYRGDKGFHLLTAEVVTGLRGEPIKVTIANGHISDKGMFNLETRNEIEHSNIVGLADRGYQHQQLIRPDDKKLSWTF